MKTRTLIFLLPIFFTGCAFFHGMRHSHERIEREAQIKENRRQQLEAWNAEGLQRKEQQLAENLENCKKTKTKEKCLTFAETQASNGNKEDAIKAYFILCSRGSERYCAISKQLRDDLVLETNEKAKKEQFALEQARYEEIKEEREEQKKSEAFDRMQKGLAQMNRGLAGMSGVNISDTDSKQCNSFQKPFGTYTPGVECNHVCVDGKWHQVCK
jgi:hypothetical protein